uniref:Peptidase S1 domain-containing protein n=1 Tax=Musca domestica TaxID=7370 RepID=A0A1I8MM78_MUSDO
MLTTNLTEETRHFMNKSQCGHDSSQDSLAKRILVCCTERPHNRKGETVPGNVLPKPGECGTMLSNRILGGNTTEIDEFPWMALIQYKTAPDAFGFYCGGSLINSHYVLTAAHCIKNLNIPSHWELYAVRLGEWDLRQDPDCVVDTRGRRDCFDPYTDIRIDYAIVHPSYIPTSLYKFNDIALIRLVDSVTRLTHFTPICLPVAKSIRSKLFTNQVMEVAGWGATENGTNSPIKLKINQKVWNATRCKRTYHSHGMAINSNFQMCAGGEEGVDTCFGDSGGPLMVTERIDDSNVYFVAGLVSYGPQPCGLSGWPGIYTRVGSYMDWIIANLLP